MNRALTLFLALAASPAFAHPTTTLHSHGYTEVALIAVVLLIGGLAYLFTRRQ